MADRPTDSDAIGEGYLSLAAILAGLVAGVLVALRDLLVIMTWADLRNAAQFVRDGSLLLLSCIAVGVVLGLLAGILLAVLRRVAAKTTRCEAASMRARMGLVAVIALGLILRALLLRSEIALLWVDVGLVALGLLALVPASADRTSRVAWVVRVGIVVMVVEPIFMVGHALVNDWPMILRVIGYAILVAGTGAVALGLNALLRGRARRLAEGVGARGLAGGFAAIVIVPLLALGGWYISVESSVVERKLQALDAGGGGDSATGDRPDILLISVDTLRADTPGYAGGDARTPVMDALAAESFVFERAYSPAPWTRPSFASFFSGLYPSEMGVARIRGYEAPGSELIPYRWREEPVTLTEALHKSGYRTAAVVTNGQLTSEAAADQGFELFHNCKLDAERRLPALAMRMILNQPAHRYDYERADYLHMITGQVLPGIERRPALIWLHYMDPHYPYDPPTLDEAERIDHSRKDEVIARLMARSVDEMRHYINAYNAEVEYFDDWLGHTIESLKQQGLWDSSIVVFFSDHGEEFWDHGSWEHGHSLYDELIHVPLLIHLPGQTEGERVTRPVSLLDVMPTLLDMTGVAAPEGLRGQTLRPALSGRPEDLEPLNLFLEGCSWGSIRKGLLTDRHKLIYDLYHDRYSLYDLERDPDELRDIWGTDAAPDTSGWEAQLREWTDESLALMDGRIESAREEISPEMLQHLKDMGYIQ